MDLFVDLRASEHDTIRSKYFVSSDKTHPVHNITIIPAFGDYHLGRQYSKDSTR